MSSTPRKYITLGLRREKNLSDVTDARVSLNNLLNNLVNEPDGAFLSEDLDAIRGIQNTNINADRLSELAGITVETSVVQEFSGSQVIVNVPVTPLIRLNDRVENAKVITGEIPAIQGGDGLLARFVPSTAINPGTKTSTGDNIFNLNNDQNTEIFWDNGYFNFPPFLDDKFDDEYGGIQWTGFFTPVPRDPDITIRIFTTGFILIEIDPLENNTWTPLLSIHAETRTLLTTENGTLTQVTLAPGEIIFVCVGDFLVSNPDITVVEVDITNSTITFSEPVTISGNAVQVKKTLGDTITSTRIRLPPIEVANFLKIRISHWYPNTGTLIRDKYLEFNYRNTELRFSNLYSVKPDPVPGEFEIRQFLTDALAPHQNRIGLSQNNKNFYVNNSLLLTEYNPTIFTNLASIRRRGPVNITFNTANNIITGSMSNVSRGNIIVPTDPANNVINSILRVKDNIGTDVRVSDENLGVNQTISVNFIEHKGFINWFRATSSGNVVTLTSGNTSSLSNGFLIITSTSNSLIKITSITSSTTFTTSSNLNLSGTAIIYAYSDKSLVDKSKDVFCNGVFGQTVATTAPAGINQISLTSVTGVVVGQFVQFEGIIPINTQVTSISSNTITISNLIPVALSAGNTVVFVPQTQGGVVNREGCVVPLDTAPPFEGTPVGLSTVGRGIKSDFPISTLSVTADIITANVLGSGITPTLDAQFNRKVYLKARLGNTIRSFSILSSSN